MTRGHSLSTSVNGRAHIQPRPRLFRVVLLMALVGSASCGESLLPDTVVTRVEVTPTDLGLIVGDDTVVTARVARASGELIANPRVYWSSANPEIASIDNAGHVIAVLPGNTRLAASSGGKSALVQVTVSAPPVAVVQVAPATSGITVGGSLALRAAAVLATGDTVAGMQATWRSSRATVATVSTNGTVQGVTAGTASVTATINGVTGTAVVTVQPVPVAFVTVSPPSVAMLVATSRQLTATTMGPDSAVFTSRTVTWSSGTPGVASVSVSGVVTALAPGTSTVTALSEGKRGTARVTVSLVPVRTVNVVPASASLVQGATTRFTAVTLDSAGGALTGRPVKWTSAQPAVATVDSTGLVTSITVGTATLTATAEGRSGKASVTVTAPPVARVTVVPTTLSMGVGNVLQFTATLYDAQGRVITGRPVSWLSGSPSIAKVDQKGLVTALTGGSVLIIATAEGQRGIATVTVR